MYKRLCLLALITLLVAGCGGQASPQPTVPPPAGPTATLAMATNTSTPQPTETPLPATPEPTAEEPTPTEIPATPTVAAVEASPTPAPALAAEFPGAPLATDRGAFFSASGACSACHTGLKDVAGTDVSLDTAWRSTMMANSARDPYWQATVRSESLTNPQLQGVIEDKCATCHMGMARFTQAVAGGTSKVLDDGLLDPTQELHGLAMDGVSCTLCHQIRAEGLGTEDSFSGGFVIDAETAAGERELFGPYPTVPGQSRMMQSASGFVPVQSAHMGEAELCAVCHTLYTPYVDAAGEVAGTFPEQMAYFEWSASSFAESLPCQSCHMPAAEGAVQISTTGGRPQSPFFRHEFVGGNTYMLSILGAFGQELGATASSAQYQDKAAQARSQLETRTASLELLDTSVEDSTLNLSVVVHATTGHKFPTGFPSRRAWLHLTVVDAGGNVVFESGAANPDGSIVGNDNDADPSAYEPHYLTVSDPQQVQIYESILGTVEGQATTTLLAGARYLKDNRLLPAGFDKTAVSADIAVTGEALDDADFVGGSDTVPYAVPVGDSSGPFTVTAELLYQAIGYRWAQNFAAYEASEPQRLLSYLGQVPNQPVVVASATAEVNP